MLSIETLYSIGIILLLGTADCGSPFMSVIVAFSYVGQHFINMDKPQPIIFSVVMVVQHVRPADIQPYDNMGCHLY